MKNPMGEFQNMNQAAIDNATKMFGEFGKNWQAIAAEMNDYAKRSFADGTATMEKLLTAKNPEQAIEIQTNFAKQAYENYLEQASKMGALYSEMAQDAMKPFEGFIQSSK